MKSDQPKPTTGEALARRFHEIYERRAPEFGYETRKETRAFDPTTPNGRLMIAVCTEITDTQPKPTGEWTHEKLQGLLQISNEDRYVADHAFENTLDEINAALAAEREKMTDCEILNWLADRCYYPNDHPNDKICVLVPEEISKPGSFTLNAENDRAALRAAVGYQIRLEKTRP